jgi:hypothetical protein
MSETEELKYVKAAADADPRWMKIFETGAWDYDNHNRGNRPDVPDAYFDESHFLDLNLARWISNFHIKNNIRNLFDFGCSTGYYLEYISLHSKMELFLAKVEKQYCERFGGHPTRQHMPYNELNLIGVEPYVAKRPDNHFKNILPYDLTKEFDLGQRGSVLCTEVLEHIPPQFESIAVDNLVRHCDQYLFTSWAVVGQGGHGHFNEKNPDDVLKLFAEKGFILMENLTREARSVCHFDHLKNGFLVFRRA